MNVGIDSTLNAFVVSEFVHVQLTSILQRCDGVGVCGWLPVMSLTVPW